MDRNRRSVRQFPSGRQNPDAGFTLLEMVIVLAVLGLLLGLVLTRGPMRSQRLEMDAAVRDIAGALRLARSTAIAENHPVTLNVDGVRGSIQIDNGQVRTLPNALSLRAVSESGGAVPGIRFAPDGSSSGGRIEVFAPGRQMQIRVNWLTGRVKILAAG